LLNENTQIALSEKLSEIKGKYIIIKDHIIVSCNIGLTPNEIEQSIIISEKPFEDIITLNNNRLKLKGYDLTFSDNIKGKLLIYAPVKDNIYYYFKAVLLGVITFFVSFIVVNLIIYYLISKGISNPINKLKIATSRMAEGDLDFYIPEDGDEEIKSLCRAFEQMRLKLKESVDTKIKYEDNRKMLVTSISHDLKTPITSIKGYVEGLLDNVADTPEKRKKYLEIIYSKAVLTDSLIDDLLLYSKLDLNQIPFEFRELNLNNFLLELIQDYRLLYKDIIFTFENNASHKENQLVLADIDKLSRVCTNILQNSIKYMRDNQMQIELIIRDKDDFFIIEINDNGPGIPSTDLPYVFNHFYRGDSSRHSTNGSGLGLAIARQIIEGHKGKIWIVSNEGKGASVRISLQKLIK